MSVTPLERFGNRADHTDHTDHMDHAGHADHVTYELPIRYCQLPLLNIV